jgi:hypothetical protein
LRKALRRDRLRNTMEREEEVTRRAVTMMLGAAALLAVVPAARLLAHEGHDHKVMGTVTMAAADHLMVKDTAGKDVTLQVTKDTRLKSKSVLKIEDIKPGTRVVVTARQEKDKTMTARIIEVGAASGVAAATK